MSVLIKDMEMPKSCFYCPFREKVNPDDYVCMALNKEFEETFSLIVGKRHSDCPLVPIPPHGRLIDADAVERNLVKMQMVQKDVVAHGIRKSRAVVRDMATVIPADKDGE